MTHLTLVGIEVIHDRRLVSVMRLALRLSSAPNYPPSPSQDDIRAISFPQSLSGL
jgi:hypothetical protein